MNPLLVLLVFGIVLVAELPDKSMFASLILGTHFAARWVFLGAAAAFLVQVIVAVVAGSLLTLLPHRVLEFAVAALFLAGAAFLLYASRGQEDGREGGEGGADTAPAANGAAVKAVVTSFLVVFIGELGDVTQIATASFAAKYDSPVAVGVGAVLGLWTALLVALTAGRGLLRVVSVTWLHRIGAVVFFGFAGYSLVQALL